jgi:hypothetical protein
LLATRLERQDKDAIKKLIKHNSQRLSRPQLVGTLPLASVVQSNSLSMIAWILKQGANIKNGLEMLNEQCQPIHRQNQRMLYLLILLLNNLIFNLHLRIKHINFQ